MVILTTHAIYSTVTSNLQISVSDSRGKVSIVAHAHIHFRSEAIHNTSPMPTLFVALETLSSKCGKCHRQNSTLEYRGSQFCSTELSDCQCKSQ